MGVERVIRFPDDSLPEWRAVAERLIEIGEQPVVRMIDGLPAFPDEMPEPGWNELRVALSGIMVTLHRNVREVRVVAWGTNDPTLLRSWNVACWAVAAAGQGLILTPGEVPQSADLFRTAMIDRGNKA